MRNIATKHRAHSRSEVLTDNFPDLPALLKELHPDQAAIIGDLWAVSDESQRRLLLELAAQATSVQHQLAALRSDLAPQLEEARQQQQHTKDQEAIAFIERMQAEAAARSPEENAALQADWDKIMQSLQGQDTDSPSATESDAA